MKLNELIDQPLKWVQPRAFKLEYELHARDTIVATLRYPRFFDTFATAECAGGTCTFQGGDFRQPIVSIRANQAETNVAVFRTNMWTTSGILELPDGRKYLASIAGYKANRYDIRTEAGQMLVSYRNIWGILHVGGETQIYRTAEGLIELPWIVMLGWHLALVV